MAIETNRQHNVHKSQHNMWWTPLYVNKHKKNTNNANKTCALLQTTGGKYELNIVFMWKSYRASQHGTQNIKPHNRTTQKTIKISNTDPSKNQGWTHMLKKGKQFLFLIRHPPCYSYIQSSPAKVLAVI